MPDLTDQWIRETTPDPNYHPLSPTVGDLEDYIEDLEYEGNQITIEWATREMRSHQMSWVKLGLVADRVRRYRLYRDTHADWNSFCQEVLGKQSWQMKKVIEAALATMALVCEGFSVLPTCVSQAGELIRCCVKGETLLTDAWYSVLEHCPIAHCITKTRIGEALGFPTNDNARIPKRYRRQLRELAERDGMTIDEKLEELIHLDTEPIEQFKGDSDCITPLTGDDEDDSSEHLQLWYRKMQSDVAKHDSQIWFLVAIAKLIQPVAKSQFGWLRQARCQV